MNIHLNVYHYAKLSKKCQQFSILMFDSNAEVILTVSLTCKYPEDINTVKPGLFTRPGLKTDYQLPLMKNLYFNFS